MNDYSFFSIDRLVEFGMGVAVAQQMVKVMNDSMQNMYVPGAMNPTQLTTPQAYYVIVDGTRVGPLTGPELSKLITQHKVTKDTYAWIPGMPNWQTVEQIPSILKLVALTPPPVPQF